MAYDLHFTFSGVVGCRHSVSSCPPSSHLAHPHALTRNAAPSTGTPRQGVRTTPSMDTSSLSSTLSPSEPVRDFSPSVRSYPPLTIAPFCPHLHLQLFVSQG